MLQTVCIDCPHLQNGSCLIAIRLLNLPSAPVKDPRACEVCSGLSENPRAENRVTASIALAAVPKDRRKKALATLFHLVRRGSPHSPPEIPPGAELPQGPGTELQMVFARAGFDISSGCGCLVLIRLMNYLGLDGCRKEPGELEVAIVDSPKLQEYASKLITTIPPADALRRLMQRAILTYERKTVA